MKRHLHLVAVAAIVGAFAAGAVQTLFSALADQSERVPPTSGIYTGPQFSALLGDAFRSVSTANKGSVAPANVGGSAVDGMEWIDDSATPWIKKRYVNGGWAVEGALDPTDSSYAGVIGGGVASIAGASTTDLGSVPQANVTITGTTTIASFGSTAKTGVVKIIRFAGALTLTYSTALTVPGGYDLTTAANDRAIVTHLGSGNWEVTQYTRANGVPVDIAAVSKAEMIFAAAVPALHVQGDGRALTRTSYPAYTAKVTRAQNGTRTASNATITAVADTSAFGVGMPVESTGVNAGCTIASIVANTSITLNSSGCVTSSGTSTVTVFLTGYGSGGSSTTVGVPNCGGAVLAGRETTASRLTASYWGGNSTAMATFSGSEYHALIAAELPNITPTFTGTGATITVNATTPNLLKNDLTMNLQGGSTYSGVFGSSSNTQLASTGSYTPAGSISGFGGNVAHPIVQPTLIAECVVRVTP